jgi:hypothetical protein
LSVLVPGPHAHEQDCYHDQRALHEWLIGIASGRTEVSVPAAVLDAPFDRNRNLPQAPVDFLTPFACTSQCLACLPNAVSEGTCHVASINVRKGQVLQSSIRMPQHCKT